MKNESVKQIGSFVIMLIVLASLVSAQTRISKPVSNIKSGIYLQDKVLMLSCKDKNAKIYYTTDGTEPGEGSKVYEDPMILQKTTVIKAVAIKQGKKSETLTFDFTRIENISSFVLTNQPSTKYPVSNIYSMFDNKPASENFSDHTWLSFEGNDFEAVVTFDKFLTISETDITCLQKTDSGIYFPSQIEYYISPDGKTFVPAGIFYGDDLPNKENFKIAKAVIPIRSAVVKAIKIIARNRGVCPEGQPDAGKKAWLFISKISFK